MTHHSVRKAAFLGICTIFLLMPCSYGAETIPFQTIEQGVHPRVETSRTVVIRDRALWSSLWNEHMTTMGSPPKLPQVDFTREMVIAVFLGRRPTGGFSVRVQEISVSDSGELTVHVEEVKPGRYCFVTAMITFPYHMVRLARRDGPVSFDRKIRITNCPR